MTVMTKIPCGFTEFIKENRATTREAAEHFNLSLASVHRCLERTGITAYGICNHCGRVPRSEFRSGGVSCLRDHRRNYYVVSRLGGPRRLLYELLQEMPVERISKLYVISNVQARSMLTKWNLNPFKPVLGTKNVKIPDDVKKQHFEYWRPNGKALRNCLPQWGESDYPIQV